MSMSTQEIMHGRTVDWTIEKQHNIKVGDIFYNSWGWEQTNIDYYQVIAVTKKMISIQQLESSVAEYNECFMTGKVIPKKILLHPKKS